MTRIELTAALLVGIYWIWTVVTALRSGTVRYRRARHARDEEPRTFWLTLAWYALLAIVCLTAAVYLWPKASL